MLKTKFENTCKERYGTKNPVFSSTVKKRISNGVKRKLDQIQMKYSLTNLQRYGVKNPFQSSVIREQIRKSYIIQSYMKKLPLITENLIPLFSVNELNGLREKKNEVLTVVLYEFKCKFCGTVFKSHMYNKLPKCPKCFPKPVSLVEIEIENFISSIYFSKIIKHERSILRGKELDFYLPDKKLAIEYDSFYYHSELSGGKDKYYHLNKTLECEKQGIRLIHIFEDEWLYKQKIVKSKLCDTLGLYDNDVNKCKVVEISTKTKNEFLNQYHIQGEDNSSIKLGVFCLEKLVGVMTFNRYGDDGEFVLSRFVGSKINSQYLIFLLLNFFIERHTPAKIIAYIDKRWDSGILYEKSGFKRVDGKPPNYWYVKNGRRISVLKNLDWRLNGYDRIWDCGISTYEWNLVKNSVV